MSSLEVVEIRKFIAELKLGMYVCRLDRPWLDTPYEMAGVLISDPEDLQRVGQSLLDQFNAITAFDPVSRRGSLTVDLNVPASDGRRCQYPRLEKAAIKKPAIDTQGVSHWVASPSFPEIPGRCRAAPLRG